MLNKHLDKLKRKLLFWKHSKVDLELEPEELQYVYDQAAKYNMNVDQFVESVIEQQMVAEQTD